MAPNLVKFIVLFLLFGERIVSFQITLKSIIKFYGKCFFKKKTFDVSANFEEDFCVSRLFFCESESFLSSLRTRQIQNFIFIRMLCRNVVTSVNGLWCSYLPINSSTQKSFITFQAQQVSVYEKFDILLHKTDCICSICFDTQQQQVPCGISENSFVKILSIFVKGQPVVIFSSQLVVSFLLYSVPV